MHTILLSLYDMLMFVVTFFGLGSLTGWGKGGTILGSLLFLVSMVITVSAWTGVSLLVASAHGVRDLILMMLSSHLVLLVVASVFFGYGGAAYAITLALLLIVPTVFGVWLHHGENLDKKVYSVIFVNRSGNQE